MHHASPEDDLSDSLLKCRVKAFRMSSAWPWKPTAAIVGGVLLMLLTAFTAAPRSGIFVGGLIAGAAITLSSLILLRSRSAATDPDDQARQITQQKEEFELLRQQVGRQLEEETTRLEHRQRELAGRFIRFHEFMEYPHADADRHLSESGVTRLSEQDRQVTQILEAEARRVYEKIRANGYWVSNRVDSDAIRQEVFELIQRVARVYSPDSRNPLLETSFEQLARAASRVCLHVLVVLEQLPLDVQQYNINALYGYVRKAVSSYGTYQKAAPWLAYLSRGAYIGRFAAGANPVTIGAWWLATEIGRRGATRFVENVVDRQAIAVLHDIVTVLGVEVSNVYGPGHRQRDPSWVLGAEIAELTQRFPLSRESLKEALRLVTALPLKSEYDRIYLYRCLAEHKAAGLRISDPAMLTREQREQIAKQLEHFFTEFIHGVKDQDVTRWKEDVEHRLDLKLSLTHRQPKQQPADRARQCVESIHAFLTSVVNASPEQAARALEDSALVHHVPAEQRSALFQQLSRESRHRFEPPDLDPSETLTQQFLQDLVTGVIRTGEMTPMVESLLLETGGYFRRTAVDMQAIIDSAAIDRFRQRCANGAPLADAAGQAARTVLNHMLPQEVITGFYTGIVLNRDEVPQSMPTACLVALQPNASAAGGRAILLQTDGAEPLLWSSDATACSAKKDGFLIDDCVITGGCWNSDAATVADCFTVSGIFRGGGYEKWFAPIIAICPTPGA